MQAAAALDQSDEFRALFDAHFDYVCRSLRRMGVAERDLEDLAQEVFVRVYERLPTFDGADDPRPWLFSFVARLAANYRRLARHRREVQPDGEDVGSHATSPEELTSRREARELVLRALGEIKFERRPVFVMHDIDGVAAPAIATALGIPTNTVYSRLRLARADFKKAVQKLQGGIQ